MVGHAGKADSAEEDGVMVAQTGDAVRGHHAPGAFVSLAIPIEQLEAETEAEFGAGCFEHFESFRYYLFANSISRNYGYMVDVHCFCST